MWPFMIVKMGLGGESRNFPLQIDDAYPVPKLPKRVQCLSNVVCRPPSQPYS